MEGAQLVAKTKETKQLYFARAKKLLQVGVLDVPGLKAEYKQSELTYVSGKIWIDICIVDHKIVHVDEEFKSSSPGQYQPITSTAWRIQKNAACGGLGFLLSKKATEAFEEGSSAKKRILTCHFGGNQATTAILHYAPEGESDDFGQHYNILSDTIKAIPAHNLLLVIGDCI